VMERIFILGFTLCHRSSILAGNSIGFWKGDRIRWKGGLGNRKSYLVITSGRISNHDRSGGVETLTTVSPEYCGLQIFI